jgi:hypothetical protein
MQVLMALPTKERDVLFRRYGLAGFAPMTLQQIGAEFYVTRERIRQIENGAMRRLGRGSRLLAFEKLLALEEDAIWDLLSGGDGVVLPGDVDKRQDRIEPLLQLTLNLIAGGIKKWVARSGERINEGWLRSHTSAEQLRSIISDLQACLHNLSLPRSVNAIAGLLQLSPKDLLAAVRISGNIGVFEDYLTDKFIGPQAKRTIRLHKLYLELQADDLIDFTLVVDAYRSRYPDDAAVSRVFELQMRRAPHLFVSIFDSVWLALPDFGMGLRRVGSIRYNGSRSFEDHFPEEETIGHWLVAELRRSGPSRAVDLRDKAARVFGGRIATTSIQAVLVSNGVFIRLAPGIFGLQEHLVELTEGAVFPDAFFSTTHCRYYAMCRRAGEPINM